jgi:hypothetical protein
LLVAIVSAAEVGKLPDGRRENTQSTIHRNKLSKIVPARMAKNRVKQIAKRSWGCTPTLHAKDCIPVVVFGGSRKIVFGIDWSM